MHFRTSNELRILSAALCVAQNDADANDCDTIRSMRTRIESKLTLLPLTGLERAFAAARENEGNVISEPVQIIAAMLDYPSVYMGGPSRTSRRKAERIWQTLQDEGYVKEL